MKTNNMSEFDELREMTDNTDDVLTRTNEYCLLVDELLGDNPEERGLMNEAGAVGALADLAQKISAGLEVIDKQKNLALYKKFEAYLQKAKDRLLLIERTEENVSSIKKAVSDSANSFSAFSKESV